MRLTQREKEILKLLYKGFNSSKIADKLCIARCTAKTHITNILDKLHVHSVHELLAKRIEELENNQLSTLSKNLIAEVFLEKLKENVKNFLENEEETSIVNDTQKIFPSGKIKP